MIDEKTLPTEFASGKHGLFVELHPNGRLAKFGMRVGGTDVGWVVQIESDGLHATARRLEEHSFSPMTGARWSSDLARDSETLLREWLAPFVADLTKRAQGEPICPLCGVAVRPPKKRIESPAGCLCSECIREAAELFKESERA